MNTNNPDRAAEKIIQLVVDFNDALNVQNVNTMMSLMTVDCIFENTEPPPDGTRYVGQATVRAFWEEFFHSSQGQTIEIEDIFAAGNQCAMRWVYRWVSEDGNRGHIRGMDMYTVRDGLIAQKYSYVKG